MPAPVVALNRDVAVAEVAGPAANLAAVDPLDLAGYHLSHATRADLLRRLDCHPVSSQVLRPERIIGQPQ